MFLKLIALAAVGGAAWLFMRPQIPILPPGIISRKRKGVDSENAVKGKKRASGKSMRTTKVCLLLPPSRTAKHQALTQTSDNIQLSSWTILDALGPHRPHLRPSCTHVSFDLPAQAEEQPSTKEGLEEIKGKADAGGSVVSTSPSRVSQKESSLFNVTTNERIVHELLLSGTPSEIPYGHCPASSLCRIKHARIPWSPGHCA